MRKVKVTGKYARSDGSLPGLTLRFTPTSVLKSFTDNLVVLDDPILAMTDGKGDVSVELYPMQSGMAPTQFLYRVEELEGSHLLGSWYLRLDADCPPEVTIGAVRPSEAPAFQEVYPTLAEVRGIANDLDSAVYTRLAANEEALSVIQALAESRLGPEDIGSVVAGLEGGQVSPHHLPAIRFANSFLAANADQHYITGLTVGDVCVRADLEQSFILMGQDSAMVNSWVPLTGNFSVTSVNGQTGVAILTPVDVGAAPALHTHDVLNGQEYRATMVSGTTVKAMSQLLVGEGGDTIEFGSREITFRNASGEIIHAINPHISSGSEIGTVTEADTIQYNLAMGTVETGLVDAEIVGSWPNQTLNLSLPQGPVGATGATGPAGKSVVVLSGEVNPEGSVTGDPGDLYFRTDTPVERTNLIRNPISSTVSAGTYWGASRSTISVGDGYLRATITDALPNDIAQRITYDRTFFPVTVGNVYSARAQVRTNTGRPFKIYIVFYNGTTQVGSTAVGASVATSDTTFVDLPSVSAAAPATATVARIEIALSGTGARSVGQWFDVRNVAVVTGDITEYFDGNSADFIGKGLFTRWQGTPNDSVSYLSSPPEVGFKASGTGNTGWKMLPSARGVIDLLAGRYLGKDSVRVDPRDHGAKGDGVTDDSAAILSAVNRADVLGVPVYLSAGRYICTVSLTTQNVWITGPGVLLQRSGQSVITVTRTLGATQAISTPVKTQWGPNQPSVTDNVDTQQLTKISVTSAAYSTFQAGDIYHLASKDSYPWATAVWGTANVWQAEYITVLGIGIDLTTPSGTALAEGVEITGSTSGAKAWVDSTDASNPAARILISKMRVASFQVGETITVNGAVVGTIGEIYLVSPSKLKATYATTPQLKKLATDKKVVLDITVEATGDIDVFAGSASRQNSVTLLGCYWPLVTQRTNSAYTRALTLTSCFEGDVDVRCAEQANHAAEGTGGTPAEGAYGYGVEVKGCTQGTRVKVLARRVRHAVTSNTGGSTWQEVDVNQSPLSWGTTKYIVVHDSIAENTFSDAFDTHPGSEFWTFDNCHAINSGSGNRKLTTPGGFQNRGVGTTYRNCIADGVVTGISEAGRNYPGYFPYVNRYENCLVRGFENNGYRDGADAVDNFGQIDIANCDFSGDGSPTNVPYFQAGIYIRSGKTTVRNQKISRFNGPVIHIAPGSGTISTTVKVFGLYTDHSGVSTSAGGIRTDATADITVVNWGIISYDATRPVSCFRNAGGNSVWRYANVHSLDGQPPPLSSTDSGTPTFVQISSIGGGSPVSRSGDTLDEGSNFALGTTTGTKIGTTATQKLGFFGATPVVQQAATAELGGLLANLGLRASGTGYTINVSGAATFTGPFRWGLATRTTAVTLGPGSTAPVNLCDASAGAFTVTLGTTTQAGHLFIVKKTDSSANAVTISATSIEGAASYVLSDQYQSVLLMSTSTSGSWVVVDAYRPPFNALARASSSNVPTATVSDLAGATITVPVGATTDSFLVTGSFDVRETAGAAVTAGYMVGELYVAGAVASTAQAIASAQPYVRATLSQQWLVTNQTPGAVVFKLTVRTAGGGTFNVASPHSSIAVRRVT